MVRMHRFMSCIARAWLACGKPAAASWCTACGALLLALLGQGPVGTARADDGYPFLSEPTEYTDVLDAFDGRDLFDFRLSLGFETVSESALVQRELRVEGDDTPQLVSFAHSTRTEKRMWMAAEVGLFRDLMLSLRAPFVLEDARTLAPTALALQSGLLDTNASSYDSRVRDGVPYVDVALSYGLLNQYRTPGLPTFLVRLSGQISTGEAMVPCLLGESCFRGAGRGTVRFTGETRLSYRYRYVEPYAGFAYSSEVVTTAQDYYFPAGDAAGDLDRNPPRQFSFTLGASFIPWEARGREQRIAVDARATATHTSRGRDYSPVFDVLGSSPALEGETTVTGAQGTAPFTGLTTVDAHAQLRAELSLRVQAAKYVRFRLGAGVSAVTGHLLTGAYPCEGRVAEVGATSGSCQSGVVNPSYVPLIDRPGQRFRLADLFGLTLSASASAQF